MCGKNTVKIIVWQGQVGSPPRVREKPNSLWAGAGKGGITPACAGKTSLAIRSKSSGWDHPRVCGKNQSVTLSHSTFAGSPPRVREKQSCIHNLDRYHGITPACAGKTNCFDSSAVQLGDHPRVCGKNWSRVCIRYRRRGSPPRVREKLVSGNKRLECYRITPACAGKTNRTPSHLRAVEDHPRVCGKNSKSSNRQSSMAGSPPRVREKLINTKIIRLYPRITPACAGKT